MKPKLYENRITVRMPTYMYKILYDNIPWGMQNQVFIVIIEDLIKLLEENPSVVVAEFLAEFHKRKLPIMEKIRNEIKRTENLNFKDGLRGGLVVNTDNTGTEKG